MRFDDARRLLGRNLFADGPRVLVEWVLEGEESLAQALALFREESQRLLTPLGVPAVGAVEQRVRGTWVGLTFRFPADQLLLGAEVAEWASQSTVERLAGRPALPLEPRASELRGLMAKAHAPRLLALAAEAARRALPFLSDDEAVSVGHGRHSATWALTALPALDEVPWARLAAVPVALVTGTNGKTTSTRWLARMVAEAGHQVGSACSDGVTVGPQPLESGDWTGPAAARLVLRHPEVDFAVLETARGGVLRRGLACEAVDAALVTNVSDDHLGTGGILSLDDMAELKGVVARAVRPEGAVVLNAADARLRALAPSLGARVSWFLDVDTHPDAERALSGHALLAQGGQMLEWHDGARTELMALDRVPLTFGGTARYNVENALGAVAMARRLRLPWPAIARALEGFTAKENPGRGETYDLGGVTLFIDFAHNPDGVAAALSVAGSLRRRGGSLTVITGSAGDRTNEELSALCGNLLAAGARRVIVRELTHYLRGRAPGEVPAFFAQTLRGLGLPPEAFSLVGSEVEGVELALRGAAPGDVVALLVHVERPAMRAWLDARITT
jgi:UDP-N-acetylmuramyl tripeptide synthase